MMPFPGITDPGATSPLLLGPEVHCQQNCRLAWAAEGEKVMRGACRKMPRKSVANAAAADVDRSIAAENVFDGGNSRRFAAALIRQRHRARSSRDRSQHACYSRLASRNIPSDALHLLDAFLKFPRSFVRSIGLSCNGMTKNG